MGEIVSRKQQKTVSLEPGKTTDIRMIKKELRQKFRSIREDMSAEEKQQADADIARRLLEFPVYKDVKTVLCFVSTGLEVNTLPILQEAWRCGKNVAVPRCVDKDGKMEFRLINSMEELTASTFGLLEPDPMSTELLKDFRNSACILPGFGFDSYGYRIGFGKGYYDRFLQRYCGVKIGICYNRCIGSVFPHGRYDAAADYVVTQKYIITIARENRAEDEI